MYRGEDRETNPNVATYFNTKDKACDTEKKVETLT